MKVQHNMPALNALRFNQINGSQAAKNLEKLSSGYKINRAADDASGLAISEKMRSQINGLGMAETNTDNTIQLIQTGEGSLQEMHNMLMRMTEISVQAANGTYHDSVDREALDMEMQALKAAFDSIVDYANYNNIKLVDGTLGGAYATSYFGGGNPAGSMGSLMEYLEVLGFPPAAFDVQGTAVFGSVELGVHSSALVGRTANILFQSEAMTGEDQSRLVLQVDGKSYISEYVNVQQGNTVSYTDAEGNQVSVNHSHYAFHDEEGNLVATFALKDYTPIGYPITNGESGIIKNIRLTSPTYIIQGDDPPVSTAVDDLIDDNHPLYRAELASDSTTVLFQVGANGTSDQQVSLHVRNMSSANLGTLQATDHNRSGTIADVSVKTLAEAQDAIHIIEAAIDQVSLVRGNMGALQNRMEHTMNNLGVTKENLTAAESTLRDVDMAKEMSDFTKNSILQQSSQAMLAQANQLPQGILQLLQ